MWTRSVMWLALSVAGAPVSAMQIFDNGVVGTDSYIVSDASPGADQIVADDFVMPSGFGGITGIQWRGTYARKTTAAVDTFEVNIYHDVAGAVDPSPLYSISPSVTRHGPDADYVFAYEALFPQLDLVAGQTYWLSIAEHLSTDLRWSWVQGRDGNLRYENSVAPGFALQIPYKVDFRLFSDAAAVPEPGSIWSALWAVLAAFGVRWGKRWRSTPR